MIKRSLLLVAFCLAAFLPAQAQVVIKERIELQSDRVVASTRWTPRAEDQGLQTVTSGFVATRSGTLQVLYLSAFRVYSPLPAATHISLLRNGTLVKEDTILPRLPNVLQGRQRLPCLGEQWLDTFHYSSPVDTYVDFGEVVKGDTIVIGYTSDLGTLGGLASPVVDTTLAAWVMDFTRYDPCRHEPVERLYLGAAIAPSLEILNAQRAETHYLQIARWDHAYLDTPDVEVKNAADSTNHFIDLDPERFYVRINDSVQNHSPETRETVWIKIETQHPNGNDDPTEIELLETGVNTGTFESRSQLLTSTDHLIVNPESIEDTPVPALLQSYYATDDNFEVHDGLSSLAPDDQKNDRTHHSRVGGRIKATYTPPSGNALEKEATICHPDSAKALQVRIVVFNEPYEDTGYIDPVSGNVVGAENQQFDYPGKAQGKPHMPNEISEPYYDYSSYYEILPTEEERNIGGTLYFLGDGDIQIGERGPIIPDDQIAYMIERTNIRWAQACIVIQPIGPIEKVDAPLEDGVDIMKDKTFDYPEDTIIVINNYAANMQPDIPVVFFIGPLNMSAGGFAIAPYPSAGPGFLQEQAKNIYSYTMIQHEARPSTLSHEIGHILTRWQERDFFEPPYAAPYFFPQNHNTTPLDRNGKGWFLRSDYLVNSYRRLHLQTVLRARLIGIREMLLKTL